MNATAEIVSPIQNDPALERLFEQDRRLVALGRKVCVLKAIGWASGLEERFLAQWRAGKPELPQPGTQPLPLIDTIDGLRTLMCEIDQRHPIGRWLYKTAWSYRVAAQMLGAIGTPEFTRCSALLYGRPDFRYRSQDVNNVDSAREMLAITDELISDRLLPEVPFDIPAQEFAERLRERIGPFFKHDDVRVVLDPELSSKATAGSRRISLRATAMFSERDLEQLVEHEAFIHTATLLNGMHQPHLHALGIGSPRTTRVQEGLATFSEIVTGALDIARLRRIALRVMMVKQALDGADFIEVFKGFLEAGQSEVESYRSASRIFRGGDVRGRVCFTKDGAYLEGVMIVHVFMRKALQEGRGDLLPMLFAGRLTTADVIELAPYRDSGLIAPPLYVPPWARDPQRVLATMAFSTAAQRLRLDRLDLQRFVAFEDEMIEESGIC
ncbi:flavohemoglobin expression-modulating QEGLA motif protein [Lysobacter panacisoli]|uniref:Flavohemoglobin expression-modulating QEGLA motif protein n=1 Tax=Lysobacter panacisoli TaxID=1255263 RepID=A0ABP9KW83_9GAMM|nr:flavohemoglobin expression-modulating QEGLA motif protein [Lysobacter panacisoli]